jgi:hypothetical protein
MRLVVRMWMMVALLGSMEAEALSRAATQRGVMAFHYATPLTAEELAWYSRFELLVTHDPLPRAQVEALHARGTKLILYEWSVAFYGSLATPWQRALPPSALLHAKPLRGHAGASDSDAFYYDPVSKQHAQERALALRERLRGFGYDGVFFDTTTHQSVHPEALEEFKRRHPETSYDEAFSWFLRSLRETWKTGVIVTNQGFREAGHILPFVDVDVTESLITRPVDGRFVFRPWLEPEDPWNSISFLMRTLIAPVQARFPKVQFVHLNYLDRLDDTLVARIVAIAALYGASAFIAQPSIAGGTTGAAYFAPLGAGGDRVESSADRTAYRAFANGLVAVNFGSTALRIPNPQRSRYRDLVSGALVDADVLVVAPGESAIFERR